jgi:hypothetical protein
VHVARLIFKKKSPRQKSLAEANLNLIFDCFNATGQEEIDIAGDILLKIGDYVDGATLIKK